MTEFWFWVNLPFNDCNFWMGGKDLQLHSDYERMKLRTAGKLHQEPDDLCVQDVGVCVSMTAASDKKE